jgi:hypothetical protein
MIVRSNRRLFGRWGRIPHGHGRFEWIDRVPAAIAMTIGYHVAGNGEKPAPEPGVVPGWLKLSEVGEHAHEYIARGVLGLFPVAKPVKAEAQDRIEIAIVKGPKCRVIALGSEDEQRVGTNRRWPLVRC